MAGVAVAAAAVLLVAAALAGPSLLDGLDVSAEAAEIAAGIVLLVPAFTLLARGDHLFLLRDDTSSGAAVLPLSVPLLAGPAPLAVVAALGAAQGRGDALAGALVAVAVAAVLCLLLPARQGGVSRPLVQRVAGRFMGAAMVFVAFAMIVDGVLGV
jgi:multiple antibiotic resistance protein